MERSRVGDRVKVSNLEEIHDMGTARDSGWYEKRISLPGALERNGLEVSLTSFRVVLNAIPDVAQESLPPYDYILTVTKNCPDIPPTLESLIAPAVTPGHTVIVMIQNGLNIEKPMFQAFPTNIVLSGVSMIDSHEGELGTIYHEEGDKLALGAFPNPNLASKSEKETAAAKKFIEIYGAAGKTDISFQEDVAWGRWRKLIFNACLNPICAITGLDDARIRLAPGAADGLVKPAMKEIFDTAAKLGHKLPEDIMDTMLNADPMDLYLKPSMQVDYEKGNYMEFEYLVGEPLREAEKVGVPTPTLKVIYEICKALQWRIKETKGLVVTPPKRVM
jgi:2-dehydropantoate 2-reductase